MRSKLWQIAQRQSESLKKRDEVIGIGLYGSVAYNKVTPFSDVDMFVITIESEHDPAIEHRLCDGTRVDFIWETLERWQKIQYAEPTYMPWLLVKALLLGSDDTILYDPQGIIRSKRDELRREVTYENFVAHDASSGINYAAEELQVAIWHEEEGRFTKVWECIGPWSSNYLFGILTDLTNCKRIEEALQVVDIPGLADHVETIINLKCAVNGLSAEYVKHLYEVDKAYWEHQLESIWNPLRRHLAGQGVRSPEKLEVTGELILPYGGVRVYEIGRALWEHNFSLEWAKDDLEQGNLLDAVNKIRYEDIINNSDVKWTRIEEAINSAGYDTGMIIRDALDSEDFRKRTEIAKSSSRPSDVIEVTASHANQLISAVYECLRLISEYFHLYYPRSFESVPKLFTLSRDEIVQRQRKREICIDNELVFLIISKERAAVKSLVFKPGTNKDLIETFWNDAYLFDLSSVTQQELRGKWALIQNEISDTQAKFVFSQEGYEVMINIVWSENGITVSQSFKLPRPIAINNNIAIGGRRWPKPKDDYWATTINGRVEVGNYTYRPGPHNFIYPPDGRYFIPQGCWISAWNESGDEVYGFTFSPNCGSIIASGAGTDFEFYLPAGESTLRFHVVKPKPTPPYAAIQQWAIHNDSSFFNLADGEPLSPYFD